MTLILEKMYSSLEIQVKNLNKFEDCFLVTFESDNDYWEAINYLASAMAFKILEEYFPNNILAYNLLYYNDEFMEEFTDYLVSTPMKKFNIKEIEEMIKNYHEQEANEAKTELEENII